MYKDTYPIEYFGETVIEATRELTNHIWGHTKRERILGIQAWITAVSAHYGIQEPRFVFIEGEEGRRLYAQSGGGRIIPSTNDETGEITFTIEMYRKFSLTTLLHEYAHVLQHMGLRTGGDSDTTFDAEDDAREWSCSLYFNADPDRYMRAVTDGKLRFA